MDLRQKRARLRRFAAETNPQQAIAAHYALHYPESKVNLHLHSINDEVDGFLVSARTGFDLFRPFVATYATNENSLRRLLQARLSPSQEVFIHAPADLGHIVFGEMRVADPTLLRMYRLEPSRFEHKVNILTVGRRTERGFPFFEIRNNDMSLAQAGVNWRSPSFAEVYVNVHRQAQGRGYGFSVLNALVSELLQKSIIPYYVVDDNNTPSIKLAEKVGFTDTDARFLAGYATRNA